MIRNSEKSQLLSLRNLRRNLVVFTKNARKSAISEQVWFLLCSWHELLKRLFFHKIKKKLINVCEREPDIWNDSISPFYAILLFLHPWTLRKVSAFRVFLFCIFPYLDWIRGDTLYLSVFGPNAWKCRPEKLQIRILFRRWKTSEKRPAERNALKNNLRWLCQEWGKTCC